MKTPPDFPREYGQRVAASPTPSSFNQPWRSADLPIEVLQANRLWRLFPVLSQSRLAAAKMQIADATADLAQLEQWACEHPGCNWGLATGLASGVFVLEVDTRRAGSALPICDDAWDWQTTLQMRAGDAGYAFFRWPAGRAMRDSGKNPAPGLRIHGEGDYVLVPPSACSSGASHVYLDPDAAIAAALLCGLSCSLPKYHYRWRIKSIWCAISGMYVVVTCGASGLMDDRNGEAIFSRKGIIRSELKFSELCAHWLTWIADK